MKLNNVSLVIIDDVDVNRVLDVLDVCNYYIDFYDIFYFTSLDVKNEYVKRIDYKIDDLYKYSNFLLKDVTQYIKSEYILVVQWDGFVLNPSAWNHNFLNYDYIGAPWKLDHRIVGNGGFSLRSFKLIDILSNLLHNIEIKNGEDFIICGQMREILENRFKIKFPSIELAKTFSVEDDMLWSGEFGFHNWKKVQPFKNGWKKPNLSYRSDIFINNIY